MRALSGQHQVPALMLRSDSMSKARAISAPPPIRYQNAGGTGERGDWSAGSGVDDGAGKGVGEGSRLNAGVGNCVAVAGKGAVGDNRTVAKGLAVGVGAGVGDVDGTSAAVGVMVGEGTLVG
jgi:hypothetical protein